MQNWCGGWLATESTLAEELLPVDSQVAIKRIPDVLASPEQAKRVLREVAILRRLAHPNVIALRDAFTRPSATGKTAHSE